MKRAFDVVTSILALVMLLPILLCLSLLVKIKDGSPVIFKQPRAGLNGKTFLIYKFRTMTNQTDNKAMLEPDETRLTDLGIILRNTSLDELPTLFNVLKGNMSLVGPRPLLIEYLPLYNEFQRRRHEIKPGITGWAQVNGRNTISWQEKFEYDIWYVDNQSLWLDLKIFLMTIIKIIKRDGIVPNDTATMEKFIGNK